jgi:hypothetical protein
MEFKYKVDFVVGALVLATILTAIDVFLIAIYSIRIFLSNPEIAWDVLFNYFFKSWYIGLHIVIVFLYISVLLVPKYLKCGEKKRK